MAVWATMINFTWASSHVYSQRSDPQQQADLEVGLLGRLVSVPQPFPASSSLHFSSRASVGRGREKLHVLTFPWMANSPLLCWPSYLPLYEWSHGSRAKIAGTLLQAAPLLKLWSVEEKWVVGSLTGPACIGFNSKEFHFEI